MYKKGFISAYFLFLLFIVITLVVMISSINTNHLKTIEHLKIASTYLNQEISVINQLRCTYKSGELISGVYDVGDISYQLDVYDNEAEVTIISPLYEHLVVSLNPEGHLISDYQSENDEIIA